jgi:phosphoribosylaminoimidazolecarboxamide formyltransferase/IMP cyclohydrolase
MGYGLRKVRTALISVYDKTGLVGFARELVKHEIRVVSTGSTAKTLRENKIPVTEVQEVTRFPEMMDGRVKTLHPLIHGGILARRDKTEHLDAAKKHGIGLIDLVVVSLYPFEKTLASTQDPEKIIEMIDIGGPAMLRSAAKNHDAVASVCDPADYAELLRELEISEGSLTLDFRKKLAGKVFAATAAYDGLIARYFAGIHHEAAAAGAASDLTLRYSKVGDLRYGENPHQKAALYRSNESRVKGLADAKVHGGKELSYNNYLDLEATWALVSAYDAPSATVVKHNNPCGFAIHKDLSKAFKLAFACDPISAFGGIVGLNRSVDGKTARTVIAAGFLECVIAPGFTAEALEVFKTKKNLRVVEIGRKPSAAETDFKRITGGLLVQDLNELDAKKENLKLVTRKKPTAKQLDELLASFRLTRFVKSNAIVVMKNGVAYGIGMGQPSRVDSAASAFKKAGKHARGAVLASDGFFPKPDSIQLAARNGIKAIIQPGGSIQEPEIIKACDKAGIAMVLTGIRNFSH